MSERKDQVQIALATGVFQGLDLVFGMLIEGRNPGLPDGLGWAFRQKDFRTSFPNLLQSTVPTLSFILSTSSDRTTNPWSTPTNSSSSNAPCLMATSRSSWKL